MSKKDYVMIAATIHAECASQNFAIGPCASAKRIAEMLAIKFAASNPQFKRDVFMRACGF